MKKFVHWCSCVAVGTLIALALGHSVGLVVCAQEQKGSEQSAVVYDYKGLRRGIGQFWLVFEVFTSDPKWHEDVWVPPWTLRVEARESKDPSTTIVYRLKEGRGYTKEARLLVSTADAREQWEKYLAALRKQCEYRYYPNADEVNMGFENESGIVVTVTPKRSYERIPPIGTVSIIKVVAPLEGTTVLIDHDARGVTVVVEFGLAYVKEEIAPPGPDRCFSIVVPKLELRVPNGAAAEYWEGKFNEWREKLKPHVVLPPVDRK